MNTQEIAESFQKYYVPIWAPPLDFVVGEAKGPYLFNLEGKKYIDFVGGIAVNALGYKHPALLKTYKAFSSKPLHVSSLYLQEDRVMLAKTLVENSFADKVFFCNSGTEAIEGCIKFARKWASTKFGEEKHKILCFKDGFHGRTYGALSATAQEKFHAGFKPLLPGFEFLPINNLDALEKAASEKEVCAVLVEPLQAEGGIIPCNREWLLKVREICNVRKILLVFDEVQTGMGRLGTLWGYQSFGIEPDIMALAKALGGGIPFGAVLVKDEIAYCLKVGDHGNTVGGSPLGAKLGLAVLDELLKPGFFNQVHLVSDGLQKGLIKLQAQFPAFIQEVRGMGMIQGLALNIEVPPVINLCRQKGLLVCKAGSNILRLLPPLNTKPSICRKALNIIKEVFREIKEKGAL